LAAREELEKRLGVKNLSPVWKIPVEDQNHDNPPKRIVETVFRQYGKHYHETVDAPMILAAASYVQIADRCPQCFKPFVDFLLNL
jgi:hypothetical protein